MTKRIPHDEVSTEIAAAPETVYALVSDITRMGEWSPETVRAVWTRGATGPAVGARTTRDGREQGKDGGCQGQTAHSARLGEHV